MDNDIGAGPAQDGIRLTFDHKLQSLRATQQLPQISPDFVRRHIDCPNEVDVLLSQHQADCFQAYRTDAVLHNL
jgi:hypothetical protein